MLATLVALGIFVAAILVHRARHRNRLPLPPGPRGKPFIGNALDIPAEYSWLYYTKLYEQYGPVVYLSAMGQHIIVLNTIQAVNDILVKRAANSSDRPDFTMLGDLMHFKGVLTLHKYGPQWRLGRRILRQYVRKGSLRQYHAHITKESCLYVGRIQAKPAEYAEDLHLSVVRSVVDVTYGFRVENNDDPYAKSADAVMHAITEAFLPGAYLVDMIPSLRYLPSWFPGAQFRRHAKTWAPAVDEMAAMPYERVKKELAEGTAAPSFTSHLLEMDDKTNSMTSYDKMWLSGTLYGTASDTTWIIIIRFLLVMTLYPDVQRKAQEEIDTIVGVDQLPTFDDQDRLPYIDALIKEVYRWYIMTPNAVPHQLLEDEEYQGHLLPKGSWIVPNAWAITRETSIYPDPDTFNPSRFIVKDGEPMPLDPRQLVFGFGRRKCPGADFAEAMLWSHVVNILATTTVLKALDPDGKEIIPLVEFSGGIATRPVDFACRFQVRSTERTALAKQAAA